MNNDEVDDFDDFFNFVNYSYAKFPSNVEAKYCFENELIKIPDTDVFLNVDQCNWIVYDKAAENLFSMTNDQFLDIYLAGSTKSQRYMEFISDSKRNDYIPEHIDSSLYLFEEIFGDIIEKEAPIKKRWKLAFDLISKRKIYLSKYF